MVSEDTTQGVRTSRDERARVRQQRRRFDELAHRELPVVHQSEERDPDPRVGTTFAHQPVVDQAVHHHFGSAHLGVDVAGGLSNGEDRGEGRVPVVDGVHWHLAPGLPLLGADCGRQVRDAANLVARELIGLETRSRSLRFAGLSQRFWRRAITSYQRMLDADLVPIERFTRQSSTTGSPTSA